MPTAAASGGGGGLSNVNVGVGSLAGSSPQIDMTSSCPAQHHLMMNAAAVAAVASSSNAQQTSLDNNSSNKCSLLNSFTSAAATAPANGVSMQQSSQRPQNLVPSFMTSTGGAAITPGAAPGCTESSGGKSAGKLGAADLVHSQQQQLQHQLVPSSISSNNISCSPTANNRSSVEQQMTSLSRLNCSAGAINGAPSNSSIECPQQQHSSQQLSNSNLSPQPNSNALTPQDQQHHSLQHHTSPNGLAHGLHGANDLVTHQLLRAAAGCFVSPNGSMSSPTCPTSMIQTSHQQQHFSPVADLVAAVSTATAAMSEHHHQQQQQSNCPLNSVLTSAHHSHAMALGGGMTTVNSSSALASGVNMQWATSVNRLHHGAGANSQSESCIPGNGAQQSSNAGGGILVPNPNCHLNASQVSFQTNLRASKYTILHFNSGYLSFYRVRYTTPGPFIMLTILRE